MSWECFVDVVGIVTQIVTTAIAGFGAWVAYQTLLRMPEQEPEPEKAVVTEAEARAPTQIKVFETSYQTTYLKVTDNGLKCYLEDTRPGKRSGHQWTLTKTQAKEILSKREFRVYSGYKLRSGLFSIGPRRNWLYSKKLYPEPTLLELDIEKMLGLIIGDLE